MRHGTEPIARPVLRVVADVAAIGGKLLLARHDFVPVVELPKMLAYIFDLSGTAHIAVNVAGPALEAAQEKAKVVLLVRRTEPYSHNGVEMVGHHDKLVEFEFRVLRRHPAPIFFDSAPELVQFAAVAHYRAENRLVVRGLLCDEKPAVAIVDVGVAKRLVEARRICRTSTTLPILVSCQSHAHAEIIPQSQRLWLQRSSWPPLAVKFHSRA